MSWLENRINTTGWDNAAYFTAVDPADFFEWKFANRIPKGTIFTRQAPPSQTFTLGYIIATADLLPSAIEKTQDGKFKLSEDLNADIKLKVGNVSSPSEVLEKYKKMKHDFQKDIENFRITSANQKYLILPGDKIRLAKVENAKSGNAKVSIYDEIGQIQERLAQAKKSLAEKSWQRKGRAYEFEDIRRFEQAFTMLQNKKTAVDPSRVDYVLKLAGIEPLDSFELTWQECLARVSPDAKTKEEKIKTLESLSWIKSALSF